MTKSKIVTKQVDGESMQDYIKFLVFLEMGPARTMNQAFQKYYETADEVSPRWQELSQKYRWAERAAEYDKASQQPATK